jgi:lipopolysaccharide biosynthesis regulator YciM
MRELAVQYPNESDLLYELARQERLDENTDEALRLLNRALEIVPGSIPVRLELARTYEARDEKDKALEILKVIDAARPNTTLITDWIKRLEAEAPAS